MNKHVKYGLNQYVADPDPQCAVLLKGDWGCGKTHFIKEWIKEQSHIDSSMCDVVYVSLFGLNTIGGLKDAINKAISPIMYKVEKYGKELLKSAAKIVLKYESSITNLNDAKFQYELNPLDLLSQINLGENSNEYKLFVFDDVERCDISLKELFGFIDYLFEQVGCKVVLVVGKTDLQGEGWNEIMHKYQEKVVGREYEIIADVNSAVYAFIDEIKIDYPNSYDFFVQHQDAIAIVWVASKFRNLRSIRQSIRMFAEVFESLQEGADMEKFRFFVNYLAYSLEYYNGDKSIFPDLAVHVLGRYFEKNESPARTMIDKYNQVWQKLGIRLFDIEYLDDIKAFVIEGKDIKETLNKKITAVVERSLSSRLKEISYLENRDVDLLIREAKKYLKASIVNVSEYLFVTYVLCYWENKSVCVLRKSFEKDCLKNIEAWLNVNLNPSQLAQIEMQVKRSLAIQDYEGKFDRFTWLSNEINLIMSDLKNKIKEPILNQLESLSDENINDVIISMSQPDIWGRASYCSQSLFNRINLRKFCQRVRKMNNKSKMKLSEALVARYEQNYSIGDYRNIFGCEVNEIEGVKSILESYKRHSTSMTRVAYERLIEPLNHALKKLKTIESSDNFRE